MLNTLKGWAGEKETQAAMWLKLDDHREAEVSFECCDSLVKRTATKGTYAGSDFLGCSGNQNAGFKKVDLTQLP